MYLSIGDIVRSKAWLSLELRPGCGWALHTGKTYEGTLTGVVISFGWGVLIGHIR
jgi:hypothetical protein